MCVDWRRCPHPRTLPAGNSMGTRSPAPPHSLPMKTPAPCKAPTQMTMVSAQDIPDTFYKYHIWLAELINRMEIMIKTK